MQVPIFKIGYYHYKKSLKSVTTIYNDKYGELEIFSHLVVASQVLDCLVHHK